MQANRPPSPRPSVSQVRLFTAEIKQVKKSPLQEVDFADFLEAFMITAFDADDEETEKCMRIVNRAHEYVAQALEGSDQLGRVFNDLPLVFGKYQSSEMSAISRNKWIDECFKLIEEKNAIELKDVAISLPQKNGDDKTSQRQLRVAGSAELRADMMALMNAMLDESCRQVLDENRKIKKQIIDILQIQELFDETLLSSAEIEISILRLVYSHLSNVILANLAVLLSAEARIREVNFAKFEERKANFLCFLKELLFAEQVILDSSGDHRLAAGCFTDYFRQKVLRVAVTSANKPVTEFIVQGTPGLKIEMSDCTEEQQVTPQLSQKMFMSYLKNHYPLEGVPKKFERENFAAVTKQDKFNLIVMIVKDNFSYMAVNQDKLASRIKDIEVMMSFAVRETLAATSEAQAAKMLTMDFLSLRDAFSPDALTPTPRKSVQERDFKQAERKQAILNCFNSHVVVAYSGVKTTDKMKNFFKRSFHPHTRLLTVQSLRDLALRAESCEEFAAILLAEHHALDKHHSVIAAALRECKKQLDEKFKEELRVLDRKMDQKQFALAVALLRCVARIEAAPLGVVFVDKTREILAARSIARHLVRLSLIVSKDKMTVEMEKIVGGIESVLRVEKLDSELMKLLGEVCGKLKDEKHVVVTGFKI